MGHQQLRRVINRGGVNVMGAGTSEGVIKGAGSSKGQGTQEHTQTVGCSPTSSQLHPPLSHLQ